MSRNALRITITAVTLATGAAVGFGAAQWRGGHAAAGVGAPAAATALAALGHTAAGERRVLYWYDPMVPTQKFDKPGKSPFMDMQLVPRYADEGDVAGSGAASAALAVSPQVQQSLGVRLATAERRRVGAAVEAVGTVQLNERDISIVQARTGGFVERVHPHAPGDIVAPGAPLADVLNPDWLGAQQEFLAVRATSDAALAQAARQRLVLLGMPAAMIDEVERSGRPQGVQTITVPGGGVITELMVRNGMTVMPGMTLARINGFGTVWLEAALPEAQAAAIRPGQPAQARFPALAGELVRGRVAAILPEAQRDTRTLRVRIELPNKEYRLRAGLFAQVVLQGTPQDALAVPAEAVIRTGRRALVYVAEGSGRFRPQEVELGDEHDEWIVVRSGLAEGQQVVASGQFLIDSEASLQGVLARATPAAADPHAGHGAPAAAAPSAGTTTAAAPAAPAAGPTYRVQGVFVEADAETITLDHEPVPALKWPAMTMPFRLADAQLVAQARALKPGQPVQFGFVRRGDDWVVTQLGAHHGAPALAAAPGARK